MGSIVVSAGVSPSLVNRIERLTKKEFTNKSQCIEHLIRKGLEVCEKEREKEDEKELERFERHQQIMASSLQALEWNE